MFGEMKRGLTVLKMRGSMHDKRIREFSIDADGMHLGRPFRNVTGILAGTPVHVSPEDLERAWSAFDVNPKPGAHDGAPTDDESRRIERRRS
jgi:circadian clock protein KaiC